MGEKENLVKIGQFEYEPCLAAQRRNVHAKLAKYFRPHRYLFFYPIQYLDLYTIGLQLNWNGIKDRQILPSGPNNLYVFCFRESEGEDSVPGSPKHRISAELEAAHQE